MFRGDALRQAFLAEAMADDATADLGRAALLIGALHQPDIDVNDAADTLDLLGEQANAFLPPLEHEERARALADWMFRVQGFRGNESFYYDPRNSFLHEVLSRHLGIPITLTTLYLEVARRCGISAYGAPVPGHFMIGVSGGNGPIFLDPFGGAELSRDDIRAIVTKNVGRPTNPEPFLRPATKRHILARMLMNLKAIFLHRRDWERAVRILDLVIQLAPDSPREWREYAYIAYRRGEYRAARAAFDRYLALAPSEARRSGVRRRLIAMAN